MPLSESGCETGVMIGALRVGALMICALLFGCGDDGGGARQTPELVRVETVSYQPVAPEVSLTGTVMARVESELSFRTAGRMATRTVDVGDRVALGEVLATLETEEQEADVRSAEATLTSAEVTQRQATTNFERQKQLFAGGYITRSAFDDAEEQLRTAKSSVETATADLGTAREQLGFTVLRADAAGVITARSAEAGQVVDAAQSVFTLARDGDRDAVFDIYEALLADDPPQEGIAVHLVADPSVTARARVREVSPSFDISTGTVRVKTTLVDPPGAMTLGAAVTGSAKLRARNVIALPWTALSADDRGPAVWVVDPESRAVSLRSITTEVYRTGEILVRDGLRDGEIVVTAGGQFLREGQIVQPVEDATS